MKAIKRHDTTYTALHHCLEAHFGNHNTARISRVTTLARSATHSGNDWKYLNPNRDSEPSRSSRSRSNLTTCAAEQTNPGSGGRLVNKLLTEKITE